MLDSKWLHYCVFLFFFFFCFRGWREDFDNLSGGVEIHRDKKQSPG